MTVLNELDRFHLVLDTIDRLPQTGVKGIYLKQQPMTNSSSISNTLIITAKTCRKSATGNGTIPNECANLMDNCKTRSVADYKGLLAMDESNPPATNDSPSWAFRKPPRRGARIGN